MGSSQMAHSFWMFIMHTMNNRFFSSNYILYKIQLSNKEYEINYNERKTLQHYVTLSHPLFHAQKHYHIFT
jgi:hypothetical protein